MKKYRLQVKFSFTGKVEIEATSYQEAKERVLADFGLVLGGDLHSVNENIIDWDFPIHPEKFVKQWK